MVIVGLVFTTTDIMEKVSFNPLGNNLEPKTRANDDDGIREYTLTENENEPYWGAVNYGSVAASKETVVDENGTEGVSLDGEPVIKDMSANAKAKSKVAPFNKGVTIFNLPGVRKTHPINTFSFSTGGDIMAPRDSYVNMETVSDKKSLPSKDMIVYKVPYGNDNMMTSDTTGASTEVKKAVDIARQANSTLDKLISVSKEQRAYEPFAKLLFAKGGSGLSQDFQNINTILNEGKYASTYKKALAIGLGEFKKKEPTLAGVAIKTSSGNQDVFGQFDHIYKYMKSGNSKSYSPVLVKWAQKNADSIMLVLMTNYMVQAQFPGTGGSYKTPHRMDGWNQSRNLSYASQLGYQGAKTKEPFFLYCNVSPSAGSKKMTKKNYLPTLRTDQVIPDLSYIFGMYSAITDQVWIGANGYHFKGSESTTFNNMIKDANYAMNRSKTHAKNLPRYANRLSTRSEDYSDNSLGQGLSSTRNGRDRTQAVYSNKEIIGALRTIIPPGENFSKSPDNIYIRDKKYAVTKLSKTKYSGKGTPRVAWKSVSKSNSYEWWKNAITSSPTLPVHPAVFRSKWESRQTSYSYVMMPIMMGGTSFPKAMKVLLDDMTTSADGKKKYRTISLSNRYVMAFNVTSKVDPKEKAKSGFSVVETGSKLGSPTNKTKSVVLTGYNGGQSFNIVDYFKTIDQLKTFSDRSGIEVKDAKGNIERLQYLHLFKHFFTINKKDDLVSGGKVSYDKGFDKKAYTKNWKAHKTKRAVVQVSPNYEKFFKGGKTIKKDEKEDKKEDK